MDATRIFYLGTRIWWAVALFVAPIVAAVTGEIALGVLALSVLVLPTFVVFGTERPWWPDEVEHLPEDEARSRAEMRKLNLWSGVALTAGIAIALLGPWS